MPAECVGAPWNVEVHFPFTGRWSGTCRLDVVCYSILLNLQQLFDLFFILSNVVVAQQEGLCCCRCGGDGGEEDHGGAEACEGCCHGSDRGDDIVGA